MIDEHGDVSFPNYSGELCNMMPIVFGQPRTVPKAFRQYLEMIERCAFKNDAVVYLTVEESWVAAGQTQRRAGIHTDATNSVGWGGWGGPRGIWMASTDGDCVVWPQDVSGYDVDDHGGLLAEPRGVAMKMRPGAMYRISDRTPHASMPAGRGHQRQFFRLVGPDIGAWFAAHSTPNPLGIKPGARVITESKFA